MLRPSLETDVPAIQCTRPFRRIAREPFSLISFAHICKASRTDASMTYSSGTEKHPPSEHRVANREKKASSTHTSAISSEFQQSKATIIQRIMYRIIPIIELQREPNHPWISIYASSRTVTICHCAFIPLPSSIAAVHASPTALPPSASRSSPGFTSRLSSVATPAGSSHEYPSGRHSTYMRLRCQERCENGFEGAAPGNSVLCAWLRIYTTMISTVVITGMHSLTHLLNCCDIQQQQLSFGRHISISTYTSLRRAELYLPEHGIAIAP